MIMKCKISFEEQLEIWKKRIIHVAPLGMIQIKLSKFKKEVGKKPMYHILIVIYYHMLDLAMELYTGKL